MTYHSVVNKNIQVQYSSFSLEGKSCEHYVIFKILKTDTCFNQQLVEISEAVSDYIDSTTDKTRPVFARVFSSDIVNQEEAIRQNIQIDCPYSVIGQPPLDGSKLIVWLLMSEHSKFYKHLYVANTTSDQRGPYVQTIDILEKYEEILKDNQMTMLGNCMRTWLFVQDVDTNYKQVVSARNDNFKQHNLTHDTHFIASTGNEAKSSGSAIVKMDAYAVSPIMPDQREFLYASTHMNPTYEYGVAFERGTKIIYGDRSHVFISGTASIDKSGKIMHVSDIVKQTYRIWENVEVLLQEAGSDYSQVCNFFVYLRDYSDYQVVNRLFDKRFPNYPKIIVLAPVCRPNWLIEMECCAIIPKGNDKYHDF